MPCLHHAQWTWQQVGSWHGMGWRPHTCERETTRSKHTQHHHLWPSWQHARTQTRRVTDHPGCVCISLTSGHNVQLTGGHGMCAARAAAAVLVEPGHNHNHTVQPTPREHQHTINVIGVGQDKQPRSPQQCEQQQRYLQRNRQQCDQQIGHL